MHKQMTLTVYIFLLSLAMYALLYVLGLSLIFSQLALCIASFNYALFN